MALPHILTMPKQLDIKFMSLSLYVSANKFIYVSQYLDKE